MRPFPIGAAVAVFAVAAVSAQEKPENIINALKDRAVVIEVTARILQGGNETAAWNSESSKVTIPGRPVTLKLVGSNVVIAAQFTPYKRDDGRNILVAQGQVWVSTKDRGMLYYTTMQSIPLAFGERVYFFPLGQNQDDSSPRIEVQIILRPYVEEDTQKLQQPAPPSTGGTTPPKAPPTAEQGTGSERKQAE